MQKNFVYLLLQVVFISLLKLLMKMILGKKYLLINGAIAGCVSLIKFNLLGLWFIWMALYFFKLISLKEIKKAFNKLCLFLVGNVYFLSLYQFFILLSMGIKRLLLMYILLLI